MGRNEEVAITLSLKDKASAGLKEIQKHIIGTAAGFGAYDIASKAIHHLRSELADIIKLGAEDQEMFDRLAAAIRHTGGNVEETLPIMDKMAHQLQLQTGIADNLIVDGFTRMTRTMFPLNVQYRITEAAANAASMTGRDLTGVLDAMIKSAAGSQMMLVRLSAELGIAKEEGDSFWDILSKIEEKVGGDVQAKMEGYTGQIKQMGIQWAEFKEGIGSQVIPALTSALTLVNDIIKGAQVSGEEMRKLPIAAQIAAIEEGLRREEHFTATLMGIGGATKTGILLDKLFGDPGKIAALKLELEALRNVLKSETEAMGKIAIPEIKTPMAVMAEEEWDFAADAKEASASMWSDIEKRNKEFQEKYRYEQDLTTEGEKMQAQSRLQVWLDTIDQEDQAYRASNEERAREAEEFAMVAGNAMSTMVDAMVADMRGMQVDFKMIFIRMAQDFTRYFLETAKHKLAAIFIPELIGLLALFDRPANDRMAMEQGRRYAQFFNHGALSEFNRSSPAIAYAGASGAILGSTLSVNTLSTELVKRSKRGENYLLTKPILQTGISNAIIT